MQNKESLCHTRVTLSYASHLIVLKVKVNESRNSPGMVQRFPVGLGSQIPLHSALEGGEVVSLMHRPPLPQEMFLVLIFTRG